MSEIMAEANNQVLAMEQDPEDEEIEMEMGQVADELQAGDGVQAVVAELD